MMNINYYNFQCVGHYYKDLHAIGQLKHVGMDVEYKNVSFSSSHSIYSVVTECTYGNNMKLIISM